MDSPVRYPASHAEQAVWLSSRIFPGSPVYNLLWQVKIRGTLDVPTPPRSIQAILDRHDSLRTSFSIENEDLVQVVAPSLTFECPLDDLSGLLAEKKQAQFDDQPWIGDGSVRLGERPADTFPSAPNR